MSGEAAGVIEFAPAKINLTLRVGPPAADGFHPIDGLTVFAEDWGDAVEAREGEGLSLTVSGPNAGALTGAEGNLALKAAYALRAASGDAGLGAALTLEKHLPVEAGLGGGSADAAATLRALNALWDLGFSMKQLAEIGSVVGSDVPACVHSRPLRMRGRGERIDRLIAWPDLHAAIVSPGAGLSTPAVFKAYDQTAPAPPDDARTPAAGSCEAAIAQLAGSSNDLEAPAKTLEPAVSAALAALGACEGAKLARMSGSGTACYALFADADTAKAAAAALDGAQPGWSARAVTLKGVTA